MTELEAIKARHSVRSYLDKEIEADKKALICAEVEKVNKESGLHIQVVFDDPDCFDTNRPDYGIFKNCKNYFVMIGKKGMDEEIGYFGQKLVLFVQTLGLNTCWAKTSYKKGNAQGDIENGEKRYIVIALGYGETQGANRKSKPAEKLSNISEASPEWFRLGVEAAMLAPTAINQQAFYLTQQKNSVKAKTTFGLPALAKMDLGIVKYNFELAAGKDNFTWQ